MKAKDSKPVQDAKLQKQDEKIILPRYRDLYDHAPAGYITVNEKGAILEANHAAARLLGVTRQALVSDSIASFITGKDLEIYSHQFEQLSGTGSDLVLELHLKRADGIVFWARLEAGMMEKNEGGTVYRVMLSDITEQKFLKEKRELMARLVTLVNTPGDFRELISEIIDLLQEWSGCEALGIRLRDGDDYPYYATRGFPPAFVQLEKHLCSYSPDGKILKDDKGNPLLACMCGNILCSRFNPAKPFYTAHGSYWSNNTTALLASASNADLREHLRNRCNSEGYESVALIPIGIGGKILGLIQFNDSRPDRFSENLISHFERIADNFAIALSQHQTAEALRLNEEYFRRTFDQAPIGAAIVTLDYRHQRVNEELCRITGYTEDELLGLGFPDITHPDDLETNMEYARKLVAGEIDQYQMDKRYIRKDGQVVWVRLSVRGLHDENGHLLNFMPMIQDITDRKQADDERQLLLTKVQKEKSLLSILIDSISDEIWFADSEKKFILANPTALKEFGLGTIENVDVEEFAKSLEMLRPDGGAGSAGEMPLLRALSGETIRNEEELILTPNSGEFRHREVSSTPVRDSAGVIIGAVSVVRDITEQKSAENELRASHQQLYSVYNTVSDVIFVISIELEDKFRFISINEAFCKTTGISREKIIGHLIDEVIPEPSMTTMIKKCRQAIDEDRIVSWEETTDYPAGRVTGDVSVVPVVDDKGNCIFLVGSIHDITYRKQAEEAIRASESMYRLLADNMTDMVWLMDLNLKNTYISPSIERLRGYTLKESQQLPLDQNLTTDSLKLAMEIFSEELPKAMSDPDYSFSRSIELEFYRKNGTTFWLESLFSVIRDESGNIVSILGVGRDITERRRTEEALRESELRFKQVSENAREWIWEIDTNGMYTYANPVIKQILGYEPEELVGKMYFWDICEAEESEKIKQFAIDISTRKVSFSGMVNFNIHKDGHEVILSTSAVPMFDSQGNLTGYRGVDVDITERKRAEEKILQQVGELRRWQEVTLGREDRNRELKQEVNELLIRLGEPIRYPSQDFTTGKNKPW